MDRADILLVGGSVIDGTGGEAFDADVALSGDRIVAIGDLAGWRAGRVLDVAGKVVAPGFIDVHTHDDRALISMPDMTPKISQGVTTVVAGNCGVSLAPLVLDRWPPAPLDLLGDEKEFRFDRFADYVAALRSGPPRSTQSFSSVIPRCVTAAWRATGPPGRCSRDFGHVR